jgi:hypothetical protein
MLTNNTTSKNCQKNIISWNLPFFLLAKFRQKEKNLNSKFEDELILDSFNCSKAEKFEI